MEELDALYSQAYNTFMRAPQTESDGAISTVLELYRRLIVKVREQQEQIDKLTEQVKKLTEQVK